MVNGALLHYLRNEGGSLTLQALVDMCAQVLLLLVPDLERFIINFDRKLEKHICVASPLLLFLAEQSQLRYFMICFFERMLQFWHNVLR